MPRLVAGGKCLSSEHPLIAGSAGQSIFCGLDVKVCVVERVQDLLHLDGRQAAISHIIADGVDLADNGACDHAAPSVNGGLRSTIWASIVSAAERSSADTVRRVSSE